MSAPFDTFLPPGTRVRVTLGSLSDMQEAADQELASMVDRINSSPDRVRVVSSNLTADGAEIVLEVH